MFSVMLVRSIDRGVPPFKVNTYAVSVMEVAALAALTPGVSVQPWSFILADPGPGEMLVAVTHCGICHSDLHALRNDWKTSNYPLVPGHEVVGMVMRRGLGVTLPVGARVGIGPNVGGCDQCEMCLMGEQNMCRQAVACYDSLRKDGSRTYGGFARIVRCDGRFALPLPDQLSSLTAAPLLCAGLTVFAPLKRWTQPGQTVAVLGIGGLGHLALQFGKALGCHVVALSSSADKKAECHSLGAEHFVNTKQSKEMKPFYGKVDFLLCTVNSQLDWKIYLRLLKVDGRFCFVGIPPGNIKLNVSALVMRRISVCGSLVGSRAETQEMLSIAAAKGVKAIVERFPATEVQAALQQLTANKLRYRAVLDYTLDNTFRSKL
eukprot:gb/GEZN01005686.1/.p1 GENE.gb/GEZN01005686.1/~~gb/GEZN01005686.1/.p1  ORF type:complete len:376 (+),score=50.09 gb/GEZN01005686.1/:285-1412(+)